jgi:ATP-dependent protease ClpP protease subunit
LLRLIKFLNLVPLPAKTLDRDTFMSAAEAKAWGLIDDIIVRRSDPDLASAAAKG